MLIKEINNNFHEQLDALFGKDEVQSFFFILMEYLHNLKRIDLALNPNFEISEEEVQKWEAIISELKTEKPIQYIIGETWFYDSKFYVNEHTLIPRPETEELVDWIVSNLQISKFPNQQKILDIGTGTGCIPISIKKNIPEAEVFAIDVSEEALKVAKRNTIENKVEVHFILQNILELEKLEPKFDVIVSNPPYVRNLEKQEIKKNVLDYEPHLALFVEDNDALLFYRKIAQLAKESLVEDGQLFFEINQYLGKQTVELLEQLGFKNIELRKDIYGNDRMVKCSL
ncbi:peptide chain release factor N(5)-glutamine methyltransferase [Flavobacterium sp.]|jgi:release factor glutamine methyltransferase|uniref:peptide chain release factor N(5)-glutamine methyltransferase n=1 Tax=Flavobacterium sp. TaxID=239 RepID=UPI002A803E2C|nr:peptide chain release factor N(5)-glutamine methyltransferase [Flavobacterium sp.]